MALPTDLHTGTLTGIFRSGTTGNPVQVLVTITPDFQALNDLPGGASSGDKGAILVDFPTSIVIDTSVAHSGTGAWEWVTDGNGSFAVNLVGYSDLVNPTQFTYHVVITRKSGGSTLADFHTPIPADTSLDLSAVVPVQASSGTGLPVIHVTSGSGGGVSSWNDLQDKPSVIAAGSDATTARSAIGAGTSSLQLGSTSTTAKAGDWKPDFTADVVGKPSTYPPSAHTHTPSDVGLSTFGASLGTATNAQAARTALGMTSVGSSVVTAADQATAQNALGLQGLLDGLLALIRSTDLAATPIMSYDSGGTYSVTSSTRPIIYCGQTTPPSMKATDRWLSG